MSGAKWNCQQRGCPGRARKRIRDVDCSDYRREHIQGNWRLADDSGITFGEIVDVVIDVNGSVTDTPEATATDTPGTYTPAPTATPITPTATVPTTAAPATRRYRRQLLLANADTAYNCSAPPYRQQLFR